ncbi:MAG: copper-binding protein [Magnetococcales bacterium]|nr:copper-binding protein [Magnetococcales bacterium]
MWIRFVLLLLLLGMALPSPVWADGVMDGKGFYGRYSLTKPTVEESRGTGVIHRINLRTRTVNLTLEPIANLAWPRKTRDMKTTRRVGLVKFRPGDRVRFSLKMGRDGHYRIFKMAKR